MEHPGTERALDPQHFYQRVGEITRQLHEALRELGYDKKIEESLGHLPDTRSRLTYIARLTGEAAEKVLNTVDVAQGRLAALGQEADALQTRLTGGDLPAPDGVRDFVDQVRTQTEATSADLTEIMMAQDFHDLTGQTVAKVLSVAANIEDALVKLLLEAAPQQAPDTTRDSLDGPVHDPRRTDVVSNQAQVDDLLESLGF